jgi:hypothetical protein
MDYLHVIHETIAQYPDQTIQFSFYGLFLFLIVLQHFQVVELTRRVWKVESEYIVDFKDCVDDVTQNSEELEKRVTAIEEQDETKVGILTAIGAKLDGLNNFVRNKVVLSDDKEY